jgi:Protein of unknown function (DUF3352)
MLHVRALLAAAAAVALLAAGCGGAKPSASADTDAPAPADSGFYATIDANRDSAQWRQLEELLARVPGAEKAVQGLLSDALGEAGLDWDEDVEPALGPTVAVVLPGGASDPVALTQPDDRGKLEAMLAKTDEKLVTREIDGWTALAKSDAALLAYEKALDEGLLSEQAAFTEATAGLPEEALARLYVEGDGLAALGANLAGIAGGVPATGGIGTLALAVVAEDDGVRLTGTMQQDSLPASFEPTLLEHVPADALVAATFKGSEKLTSQLRTSLAGLGPLLEGFEREVGVSLEDAVSLLAGEAALYVRPGVPIPEVTLVLQQTDAKQAATLDALLRGLAKAAKVEPQTTTEDGVRVTRIALGPVSVAYGAADGLLFVTTGRGGIAGFRGDGAKLVDAPAFKTAAADVAYDGSTSGLVYADVDGLVPLLQGLAGLAGGSTSGLDDVTKALGALDSVALNVVGDGEQAKLEGFVAVR